MTYKIWTLHESTMLKVTVKTDKPQNIALKVYNDSQKDTYFMDRTKMINGTEDLFVRMPMSPYTTTIKIFNVANGDQRKGVDKTFDVISVKQEELEKTLGRTKMDIPIVKNFVSFAQKFAYNAGWIAPKDYNSVVGGFKIEYLPFITNLQTGQKMSTPARVSTKNGRIQVSQEAFVPMTVPMRMAILLHEFSHYYLNSDISNETEADLNGLTIYLGLGYPIREAYAAFGDTFVGHPSAQNKIRYDIINKFIKDYIDEYKIKDVYAKWN